MPPVNDKLVVLDIDETLLHASRRSIGRAEDGMIRRKFAYRRPHCAGFLEFCLSRFPAVGVWTSSSGKYASEAVDLLLGADRERLAFVWTRDRCIRRRRGSGTGRKITWIKDLGKLERRGHSLGKVIVIDDSPEKLQRQNGNLVQVSPYFGDRSDDELAALQAYLELLGEEEDVRSVDKRDWRSRDQARASD